MSTETVVGPTAPMDGATAPARVRPVAAAGLAGFSILTLGLAAAMLASAALARATVPLGDGVFVWPGAGLALAALYIWRARALAGITLGVMIGDLATGHGVVASSLNALLAAASCYAVYYLLVRILGFDGAFRRVRDGVALLAGVALMLGLKMISAVIHTYAMDGRLTLQNVLEAWTMPIAVAAGLLIFTPLALAWFYGWRQPIPKRQWPEAALLAAAIVTLSILAFCGSMSELGENAHLPYTLFPILFWAALRFGLREVTTVIAIAAAAGLWYTARAVGPFSAANLVHGQIALMVFLTALVGTGIIVIASIRQEERASRTASERERRLRVLVDRMNEGLATFDAAGVFTSASARFVELTGYPAATLIGRRKMIDIVYGEDRARLDDADAHGADPIELRLVKRSGEVMTTLYSRREIDPEDASRGSTFALITDISESKRAQDALRESEAKYRLLVENQTELVLRIARDKRVLFASPSFRRFFDKEADEIVGRPLALEIHEDDAAAVAAAGERAWAGEETVHTEFRVMTPRGWRWLASSAQFLRDCSDTYGDTLIMVARDVTDRHRAEERSRAHLQQLAHVSRVASMGEMASAIAHEINQPLAAIANFASASVRMLRGGLAPTETALQAMERVASEAERAGEIVRRMRSFVRAEEGQLEATAPRELVEHVVRLSNPDARQSGVALVFDCDPALPEVLADPIQIEQVLLNLVRNAIEAIDATPTRERYVHLRARALAETGQIEFTVTDTGPGLAPEQLDRVFEAFYTTKTDGMGIGLALSRSIAEAHGGRLWATSVRGRGATFHLTLPAIGAMSEREAVDG